MYNENGGMIDSMYCCGVFVSMCLGINGMIFGFEFGIKDMRSGGKRRIIVSFEFGSFIGFVMFFLVK